MDKVELERVIHKGIVSSLGYGPQNPSALEAAAQIAKRVEKFLRPKEIDPEMKRFLDGVIGAVEADSYSQHMLWQENENRGANKKTWETISSGLGEQAGTVHTLTGESFPVYLSLFKAKVDGHLILFYHATSRVVDYDIVDTWLKETLPPSAFRADGYVNKTDAMNFHNVFPR